MRLKKCKYELQNGSFLTAVAMVMNVRWPILKIKVEDTSRLTQLISRSLSYQAYVCF